MSFDLIEKIIVILINIFSGGLGLWVLFANKKKRVNQLFALVTFLIILWVNFAFLGFNSQSKETAIIFYRLNLGVVSLFLLVYYYFHTIYFLKSEGNSKLIGKIFILLSAFFGVISLFTDLIIKGALTKSWGTEILFGELNVFFNFYAFIVTVVILYYTFKKYLSFPPKIKAKLHYFLIGFFIFLIANISFNIISPYLFDTVRYQHLGDYSTIFFLAFTGYAIVKKELFEVRILAIGILVSAIGVILFIFPFILPSKELKFLSGLLFLLFCVFGFYLIKAAINEQKRRKKAEKLANEFKRLNQLKNQFLLTTQHHLRTPLSGIQGYLSLMKEGTYGDIPEKAEKKVGKSLKMTKELIGLVNDFLDVAQFNIGEKKFNKEDTNLNKMIKEIIEQLEPEVEKKDVELKFKPIDNPIIQSDYSKLKEALYNIVNNAIKYTNEGKIELKIKRKNGTVTIKIKDTGIGMTKKELNKLFQKSFERGKRAQKVNVTGRGVGLYISFQIIKGLGGSLRADSKGKGKGSTFTVEMPVD